MASHWAQREIVQLGYWIPLLFVSLALIRVVALYLDIRVAAGYLRARSASRLQREDSG